MKRQRIDTSRCNGEPSSASHPARLLRVAVTTDGVSLPPYLSVLVKEIRMMLGLRVPTDQVEIEKVLSARLGRPENESGVVIEYPSFIERRGVAQLYEVRQLRVASSKAALMLNDLCRMAQTGVECSPAIVVAGLVAGTPFMRDHVEISATNDEIVLRTWRADTTSAIVSAAYKLATRHQLGHIPRSRRQPVRKATLTQFVQEHEGVSWSDRLREWNAAYPNWAYASTASMRQVYSRAGAESATDEDNVLLRMLSARAMERQRAEGSE